MFASISTILLLLGSDAKPLMEVYSIDKEKAYFKSEGEVFVKRTEHRGAGRKIGSWLAAGPIGYSLSFGKR